MRKTYHGTNKQVFDAELYTIRKVLEIALKNGRARFRGSTRQTEPTWTKVHIWAGP